MPKHPDRKVPIFRQHTEDEMQLALQRVQSVEPQMHLREDDDPPTWVIANMQREIIELRTGMVNIQGMLRTWLAEQAKR